MFTAENLDPRLFLFQRDPEFFKERPQKLVLEYFDSCAGTGDILGGVRALLGAVGLKWPVDRRDVPTWYLSSCST